MNIANIEILVEECDKESINIIIKNLPNNLKGLYFVDDETEPIIVLDHSLATDAEKACVLAEELGHYYTSIGNLLSPNTDKTAIRKQEEVAKRWAVKKLVSLKNIVQAYKTGCRDMFEMAEYLNVTELFLLDSFKKYSQIYGKYKIRGNYSIYFDPPGVLERW
ncbi:MAG TPA: ImmA/IrrE family metallo-endopeptidase [Ruminiclostridium sp.]